MTRAEHDRLHDLARDRLGGMLKAWHGRSTHVDDFMAAAVTALRAAMQETDYPGTAVEVYGVGKPDGTQEIRFKLILDKRAKPDRGGRSETRGF